MFSSLLNPAPLTATQAIQQTINPSIFSGNSIAKPVSETSFVDRVTSGVQDLLDKYNNRIESNNSITFDKQLAAAERANEMWRENLAESSKATRELRQTYYQDMVSSLRAAGLNPVLAYSSSGPGNPSVSSQGFQASGAGINNAINSDAVSNYFSTFVSSAFELGGDLLHSISSVLGAGVYAKGSSAAKALSSLKF